MTGPSVHPIGEARIRQLLAAVRSASPSASAPEQAIGEVTLYDWRDPHCLSVDQLNRLAAVMSQVAARLSDVFTRFFSREFDVSPTALTQHFASDLQRGFEPGGGCFLTFGPDRSPVCGFLAISSRTVMAWVTRLLGDTESGGDTDRPLSSLEESLLSDLVTAVLDVFLAALRPHEMLRCDGRLSQGQPDIQFEATEGVCQIAFRVRQTGSDDPSDVRFVLPCSRLATLVGAGPAAENDASESPKTPAAASSMTPRELSQTLMEHLYQMPIAVTARLAAATVGFREILDLGPGDILLLDKPIQETVELIVEGHTVFRGRPAQSDGKYAIVVGECRAERTPETPASRTHSEPRKG